MVESAHLWECDDSPIRSRLDAPGLGSILRKGQMGSRTILVAGTVRDDPVDLPLVESDHVIQALAARGPHEPLHIGILPSERGAIGTSTRPIPATRRWNSVP